MSCVAVTMIEAASGYVVPIAASAWSPSASVWL
jgi:hypothetical protein